MNEELWKGRRVLVTGHTGFKGAWLALWLERLGAEVLGLSLPPSDDQGAFRALRPKLAAEAYCDVGDRAAVAAKVKEWRPEVVFHLAAQALVMAGHDDPVGTYETNVLGTVNVLAASTDVGVRGVVVVTSDKVYANNGSGKAFTEADPLGGDDPYSGSKACADLAARSWHSRAGRAGMTIAVARSGNVIGGGDLAENRLLPDAWRAIQSGVPLQVRNPDSVRPWQFVLEPLRGYLLLAERLLEFPDKTPRALNFGPTDDSCRPVREVVELVLGRYGEGTWVNCMTNQPREAVLLHLDPRLAGQSIGWRPCLGLEAAIDWTLEWWRTMSAGGALRSLAERQLDDYHALTI